MRFQTNIFEQKIKYGEIGLSFLIAPQPVVVATQQEFEYVY
jgi:hypothetical protein